MDEELVPTSGDVGATSEIPESYDRQSDRCHRQEIHLDVPALHVLPTTQVSRIELHPDQIAAIA